MIGSIEELEKEIEQFQKNVAASGELVALLDKISGQIKQQNEEFEEKAEKLVGRLDDLPNKIENANEASNKEIKEYVKTQFDDVLNTFKKEQSQYRDELKATRERIAEAENDVGNKYDSFISNVEKSSNDILKRVDALPDKIESANSASNKEVKEYVRTQFDDTLNEFRKEQNQYRDELNATRDKITEAEDKAEKQYEGFISDIGKRTTDLLDKIDAIPNKIEQINQSNNDVIRNDVKAEFDNYMQLFSKEQKQYIANFSDAQQQYALELKKTQDGIQASEDNINQKYKDFIDDLEKMNVSNLYEQNIELKNSLNRTTIILTVISVVSVLLGVVSLFIK